MFIFIEINLFKFKIVINVLVCYCKILLSKGFLLNFLNNG